MALEEFSAAYDIAARPEEFLAELSRYFAKVAAQVGPTYSWTRDGDRIAYSRVDPATNQVAAQGMWEVTANAEGCTVTINADEDVAGMAKSGGVTEDAVRQALSDAYDAAVEDLVRRLDANPELQQLLDVDQAERQPGNIPADIADRDRARRGRVTAIVDKLVADGTVTAQDFFNAALIFQHSDVLDDYLTAHAWAKQAFEGGHPLAGWLTAATLDRHLMAQGLKQKYGTQFVYEQAGKRYVVWPVDGTVTDAERTQLGIPVLADAQKNADLMTKMYAPPTRGVE